MLNSMRPRRGGGPGPAWGVVALACGGGAAATALGGAAVGHPVGGLVIAGCVLIAPWLLVGVLVVATTMVAVHGARRRSRGSDGTRAGAVELIEALRRVIETVLGR